MSNVKKIPFLYHKDEAHIDTPLPHGSNPIIASKMFTEPILTMKEKDEELTLFQKSLQNQFKEQQMRHEGETQDPLVNKSMNAYLTSEFNKERPDKSLLFIDNCTVKSFLNQISTEDERKEDLLKPDEILMHVRCASVNPVDWKINQGNILPSNFHHNFPFIGGKDGSGVVEKIGSKVTKFKVGDEVFGFTSNLQFGTYGEYSIFKEDEVILKPKQLHHEYAASIPYASLTAMNCFQELEKYNLDLQNIPIIIHGAATAGGSFMTALARFYFHCKCVIALTSSKNLLYAKSLGAHEVIDCHHPQLEQELDYTFLKYNIKEKKRVICIDCAGDEHLMATLYSYLTSDSFFVTINPPEVFCGEDCNGEFVFNYISNTMKHKIESGILGKPTYIAVQNEKCDTEMLEKITQWYIKEGIQQKIPLVLYDHHMIRKAHELGMSHLTVGKIVVRISN